MAGASLRGKTYKVDRDFVAVSLSLAPPPAPLGF